MDFVEKNVAEDDFTDNHNQVGVNEEGILTDENHSEMNFNVIENDSEDNSRLINFDQIQSDFSQDNDKDESDDSTENDSEIPFIDCGKMMKQEIKEGNEVKDDQDGVMPAIDMFKVNFPVHHLLLQSLTYPEESSVGAQKQVVKILGMNIL